MRAHVVNLSRAGPGLGNSRWRNFTIDDCVEALGGRRKNPSGRAINVTQAMEEIIIEQSHNTHKIAGTTKKLKQGVNTDTTKRRDDFTQIEDKSYENMTSEAADAAISTLWFETPEGSSYIKLSNDAEKKALDLLLLNH